MIFLPAASQKVLASLPIPNTLVKLPPVPLLQILVSFTRDYRSLVPDLSKPESWTAFKKFIAERSEALKLVEFSNRLYENDEYPFRTIFHLSQFSEFRRLAEELIEELGFPDLANQKIDQADPDVLRQLCEAFLECLWADCEELEEWEPSEFDQARSERYWKEIHPRRRPETQRRVEQDCQIWTGFLFNLLHNAISTLAYGESLSSLVQRALAGGNDADRAMCRAVRIDDRLRQHSAFMARYLEATRRGKDRDASFLRKYHDTTTPFTDKIRFPGLYFLLALADGFGVLPNLSNNQLLDLADHANLHRYENRIEDAGYMGKRRNEYLKRKFQYMSMH